VSTRYYYGEAVANAGDVISLPAEESRHLLKTMRGRTGDRIVVFGAGRQFSAELTGVDGSLAVVTLMDPVPASAPPSVAMAFAIPWIKGGKTEFLIQKLTEIGASEMIIFQARREVARGDDSKLDRLVRVALEACKQCERIDVPTIKLASSLSKAIDASGMILPAQTFLLHERTEVLLGSAYNSLHGRPAKVLFASGPEGGWHPEEVEEVQSRVTLVSLGPRILKAETAPLVAASAMLAFSGDL